jgi:hypothetical protein
MITNPEIWRKFERDYYASQTVDYAQNLKTFNDMMEFAKTLKAFPHENPLEGIETKIRLAHILNSYGRIAQENS